MLSRERQPALRISFIGNINQFYLISRLDGQRGSLNEVALRAEGHPVDARGERARAVGLDVDGEARRMEGIDQRRVHLERRLAAREAHPPHRRGSRR